VYCSWAEMHLRHRNYDSALEIMKGACCNPNKKGQKSSLVNSVKAWSLYIDLLENLGTFDETKMAYERVIDLKIATPQIVLNYT